MKKPICLFLAVLFLLSLSGCKNTVEKEPLDAEDIPPTLDEEGCLISGWSFLCDSSQFVAEDSRIISGWILYDDGDWILLWMEQPHKYGKYVWVRHNDTVKKNRPLKPEADSPFDGFDSYGYATFMFKDLRRPIKPGYPVRVMDGGRLWDY